MGNFRRRMAAALLTAAVAAVALSPLPASGASSNGPDPIVKGEAFVDASNQHRALEKSSSLFVGDRVETGQSSRLTMLLGEDTTIRLGERARLVIDQFLSTTGGEISLQSGPMLFDRPSGSRPLAMQIKSPYGLIAVRGTKFFAGPSNNFFGVFVDHGTVVVSGGGSEVVLQAGEGTNLGPQAGSGFDLSNVAKPSAAAMWGKERIQAALASVS